MFAQAYVIPAANAGMFVVLNANGNSALAASHRDNAFNKTCHELAALRLHHGDAVDIIQQQTKPTVSINGVLSHPAAAITDGRLTTNVFWFLTRMPNNRPNSLLTIDCTTSESASLRVIVFST